MKRKGKIKFAKIVMKIKVKKNFIKVKVKIKLKVNNNKTKSLQKMKMKVEIKRNNRPTVKYFALLITISIFKFMSNKNKQSRQNCDEKNKINLHR